MIFHSRHLLDLHSLRNNKNNKSLAFNNMANTQFFCLSLLYMLLYSHVTLCNISSKSTGVNLLQNNTSSDSYHEIQQTHVTTACAVQNIHLGNFTNGTSVKLHSFPDEACNFTVTVQRGMKTIIQVSRFDPHETVLPYFYVERSGAANLTFCPKRFLVIPLNRNSQCGGVELTDLQFTVYVQANVTFSMVVKEITDRPVEESLCPRRVEIEPQCANASCTVRNHSCQNLQVYDQVVSCSTKPVPDPFSLIEEVVMNCDIQCPSNCQCELGARNVTQRCTKNESRVIYLVFPPTEVKKLHLSSMNLSSLSSDCLKEFSGLTELDLSHNQVSELTADTFTGLANLNRLFLIDNLLTRLKPRVFQNMNLLSVLSLKNNNLHLLEEDAFNGLSSLFLLDLTYNNLSSIEAPIFDNLGGVRIIKLQNNHIAHVDPLVFQHTKSLLLLDLSINNLESLEPGTLLGLSNLFFLYLGDNQFASIACGTFNGLNQLSTLTLSNNNLTQIDGNTFLGLDSLKYLRLEGNKLRKLESATFGDLTSLKSLDLRFNSLDKVNIHSFDGITNTTKILVDNHSICCFAKEASCIATYPKQAFLTCGQLLPYNVLRVVLSILGSLALVGNAMVLYWRCRIRRRDNKVQFLLIVNLSASDFLMGIYMIILVSGDVHFGEQFPLVADAWRRSQICKLAGFLAVLSSEASAFFVTLISIDRLLGVKYPFSAHRLGNKSAKLAVTGVWFLAVALSVILTLLARIDPDMYALSEVCIGLPMARRWVDNPHNITVALGGDTDTENVEISKTVRTEPGMYLSIAVFLGLNLLCFLIIAYCYIVIFITAQKTSRKASRRREKEEEIRMAAKMSVIVITDFLCWMPIILIGILVQSGAVTIAPVVYAWIVTFVLPINSSANPFLYTMATIISDNVGKRQRGSSIDSQCGRKYNGTQYYLTDTYEQVLNGHTGTIYDSLSQEGNV